MASARIMSVPTVNKNIVKIHIELNTKDSKRIDAENKWLWSIHMGYAQTHVYKINIFKCSQWALHNPTPVATGVHKGSPRIQPD